MMDGLDFIERSRDGYLVVSRPKWSSFRDELLSIAKTKGELEFVGQLIDDLLMEYEERLEEFEDME
jgi:hypothetical protein